MKTETLSTDMKLKTLKDLKRMDEETEWINSYELKAEAIKRVKTCCLDILERKKPMCIACKRDMWFNNLIEEDLL